MEPAVLASLIVVCSTIVCCVWIITRNRTRRLQDRLQIRNELFLHLLDRYGVDDPLIQSPENQETLQTLIAGRPDGTPVSHPVATHLRRGIMTVIPGTTCALAGLIMNWPLLFAAGIALNLTGIGFGISALVLRYKAKNLQPLDKPDGQPSAIEGEDHVT